MLINPCADEMAQLVIDEKVPVVTTGAEILVNMLLHGKQQN